MAAAKEAPAQIVNININSNCTTNAAVINQGDQATTQVSDSHMNMGGTHVTNEQDSKAVEVALAPKTIKQKNTFPLELQTILKMAAEQALSLRDSENQNNDQEAGQIEEDNQGTAGPVSTPPRNINTENHRVQENVRKFENTTRRMRSVSESDHSEPVSLPIVAFTKSTGQIDGRYLSEKSKNYSNPNLSSSLESNDECRKYGFTKTYLVESRQPRPSKPLLKDFDNQNNSRDDEQIEEDNQGTAGPLLTLPESIRRENESSGCCDFLNSVKLYFCDHHTFSKLDFLLTLVSIGIFIFDILSDLALAATYYTKIEDNEIYRVYFGLTLSFVIIPSVITQLISFFWDHKRALDIGTLPIWHGLGIETSQTELPYPIPHRSADVDEALPWSKSKRLVFIVIHFLQLSLIFRYIHVIHQGRKLRKQKEAVNRSHLSFKYKSEVLVISIIHLLESFMESAPQLVLQIYIILMTKQAPPMTVISCAVSLLALSTTMVSTQRYFRVFNNKTQLSIRASIVIFCWRACTILSRVVVIGLFLTVQPIGFLVCMILQWLVATVLIGKESTGDWTSNPDGNMLHNGTFGFIYIFCFIDLHDVGNRTNIRLRSRMFIFYAVVVIENVVISCWWYLTQLRSHTSLPIGNLSSTSSNETSTSLPFGNLSSTSSNETSTSLPFGNLSSTSSNETIVENEIFPTESAGIFERQHAFIILVAVHGFFLLGMFFMQVYYQVLHPSKSLPTCCKNLENVENSGTTPVRAPARTVLEL